MKRSGRAADAAALSYVPACEWDFRCDNADSNAIRDWTNLSDDDLLKGRSANSG